MLHISSVWRGSVDDAYRSQSENWIRENLEDREQTVIERINLSSFDTKKVAVEGIEILGLGGEYFDLFPVERALLIENVNEWGAKETAKLVNYLQKMESPLVVAFTHTKDSSAIKCITDAVQFDFDYIIPKENPGFGEWLVSYFEKSGSGISKQDAFKLAEFAGESRELAVSVAKSALVGNVGKSVNWKDDLSKIVTRMGFVAPYKITGAISKGDIAGSVEILTRVMDGGVEPLAVLGIIRKRYQSYIAALQYTSTQEFVKQFGGNPYAAKYLFNEAKNLGGVRIAKSMNYILTADISLKGGITGMPKAAIMEMLIIELSKQFHFANKS